MLLLIALLFAGPIECRQPSPALFYAANRPAGHWDGPLHPSPLVSQTVAKQRVESVFKQFRWELNSQRPFHEVEIPFTLRQSRPFVQANWSGHQLDCLVDTGAYFISWPQWLQLDTQQIGVPWWSAGPEGPLIPGELVVSPRIEIGGLTLGNIMTEATGVPKPSRFPPTGSGQTSSFSGPVLGIYAFVSCVFTIDYRHSKLIVRNRDYDVTRLPHAPHTLLIPYEEDIARRVVLPGTLEGHPARFMLDTGSSLICVSSAFARKNLGYIPKPGTSWVSTSASLLHPPVMQNVAASLAGKPFILPNLYVVERAGGVDVLLSASFFYNYCVTIDPVRKVLLIERSQ